MQPVLDFGIRLVIALQGLGGWLELPMKAFSYLGTEDFFMIVLPIIFWCIDTDLGIRVAFILMFSNGINDAFKMALHGPRPYWISSKAQGLATETSFGIPSNHTQSAMAIWGIMAAYLRKWWGWLIAVLLVLLIGLSRTYLGVHFPHDVLLGMLIGGIVLWLVVRFWDPVAAWAKKQNTGRQVLAAFVVSLVVFLLPFIPFVWLKATNWQPPQEWAAYATQAISLHGASTSAGTLFGLLAGLAWLVREGWFQTKGLWWKLVLRYLLGVAGVLIIRYGLKFIFPDGETALAYFFVYLRYALIGFWVTAGAPWAFIHLRLAERAR